VDTPSAVLRYRHARKACRVEAPGARLRFDASDPECARFATPLSVIVTTRPDLPGLRATQKGKAVPVRRLGVGRWSVTADPTRGDVALAGSAKAEPLAAAVPLPPRPAPVSSVCEIEATEGPGGALSLDDFQQPVDTAFQQATADAYNPSRWSWYPPKASVERVSDGDETRLRYAGGGFGAWSGLTYLFTSRDVIGFCFDASRHQGIRFRIRGHVDGAVEEFAGRVFVSLVTAETRPRTFGGDLDGQGGHFHHVVPLSPEWQTIEIPWSAFRRPTWGDTVALEAPALAKLQAIDWGVADSATGFTIDLDDLALY
jgi:hypothetical protein